jgi:AcrR family transcriptional regulator
MPQFRLELRLSRDERKQQTRERLLDAAAQVFAQRGFNSATLDEVAEAAGYTKGAVYSNFDNKADLFLALIERRIARQAEEATRALAQTSLADALLQTADGGRPGDVSADVEWMALACDFWLYARHDERAREAIAREYERARTLSSELLAAKFAQAGVPLAIPARDFAILSEALGIGLLFQHVIDPDAVPMSLLNTAVLRLLGYDAAEILGNRRDTNGSDTGSPGEPDVGAALSGAVGEPDAAGGPTPASRGSAAAPEAPTLSLVPAAPPPPGSIAEDPAPRTS